MTQSSSHQSLSHSIPVRSCTQMLCPRPIYEFAVQNDYEGGENNQFTFT